MERKFNISKLPKMAILLLILIISSCRLAMDKAGTLVIRFEEEKGQRSLTPGIELTISNWDIAGRGPGGAEIQASEIKTDTRAFTEMIAGEWTITAEGKNADGIAIVGDSETILVPENDVAYLTLLCGPLQGDGRLSISMTWPTASVTTPEITAWIKNDGNFLREYAPTEGSGTAAWADAAIPAGYYTLGIQFWDRFGSGKLVWSTVQSVHILAGQTTNGVWALVAGDLNAIQNGNLDANVIGLPDPPVAVTMRGLVPRLALGQSMSVQGNGSPEPSSWKWYLDGNYTALATEAAVTIGPDLSEGYHWLSVTAAAGEAEGSVTYRFEQTATAALQNMPQAWGYNAYGQIGDGTARETKYLPVYVAGTAGHSIAAVAAGYGHSMMLTTSGTLLAWGDNFCAQLGDGTVDERHTPVLVERLPEKTIVSITAGNFHSMALMDDGTLWAWGGNGCGQLGIGAEYSDQPYPTQVQNLDGKTVTAIACGADHALALCSDGSLWAWGSNAFGQLGDGTSVDKYKPVKVQGIAAGRNVQSIAAGHGHSLALLTDGSLLAWGNNGSGQLGDGSTINRNSPKNIVSMRDRNVTALSAGEYHSLALSGDGALWAWGANNLGQLGNGTTTGSSAPVMATNPAGKSICAIDAKGAHSLALASDGSLWAWGEGGAGQLGTGGSVNSSLPVQVRGLGAGPVVGFSAGYDHNLSLCSEDTI